MTVSNDRSSGQTYFFVNLSEEELREKGTTGTAGPCMRIDGSALAKVVDAASADGGTE